MMVKTKAERLLSLMEEKANLSLNTLVKNAGKVLGRPHSQDRTIKIQGVRVQAGVKSAQISAESIGGDKLYKLSLYFYGVNFSDTKDQKHQIPVDIDGTEKYMEKLDGDKHYVRVGCSCSWFQYAAEWWLSKEGALSPGRKARPYVKVPGSTRKPVNPDELPCVCKHIFMLGMELVKRGLMQNLKE